MKLTSSMLRQIIREEVDQAAMNQAPKKTSKTPRPKRDTGVDVVADKDTDKFWASHQADIRKSGRSPSPGIMNDYDNVIRMYPHFEMIVPYEEFAEKWDSINGGKSGHERGSPFEVAFACLLDAM